jgi:hypothetical protein
MAVGLYQTQTKVRALRGEVQNMKLHLVSLEERSNARVPYYGGNVRTLYCEPQPQISVVHYAAHSTNMDRPGSIVTRDSAVAVAQSAANHNPGFT